MINIIIDTKYFTMDQIREEIQNRINGKKSSMDKFDLMENLNIAVHNKKDNLKLLCWYNFLVDAIEDDDKKEIIKYSKRLDFNY